MRVLGGAAVAAAVVLALAGCGSQAARPSYSPTVTVVRPDPVPTAASASAPPAAPASPAPSSPAPASAPSASAGPAPSGSGTAQTSAADPGRPADQCPDDDLGVAVRRSADGGGAGSESFEVLLTNTGGETCALRGAPGVSVVGGGAGARIGPPADRDPTAGRTVRLAAGETAVARLQVVNIADGGGPLGPSCSVRKGDGYRVLPPHSTRAFLVRDPDAVACAGGPVFMTVGSVAVR